MKTSKTPTQIPHQTSQIIKDFAFCFAFLNFFVFFVKTTSPMSTDFWPKATYCKILAFFFLF